MPQKSKRHQCLEVDRWYVSENSIKSNTSFRSGIICKNREDYLSLDNNSYRPECHLLFHHIAERIEPPEFFSSCICLRTATHTSSALLPSFMPTIAAVLSDAGYEVLELHLERLGLWKYGMFHDLHKVSAALARNAGPKCPVSRSLR